MVEQVLLTCAIPEPIRPPPITVTWLMICGVDDKNRAILLLPEKIEMFLNSKSRQAKFECNWLTRCE